MSKSKRSSKALDKAIRLETSGEKVLWTGKPSTATVFRKSLPIWMMGIPWSALTFTIFAVLVLSIFFSPPARRVIPTWEFFAMGAALIFVGAFVMVGVGMLGAPFWAAWKASRSAHVITDKRLITVTVGRKTEVKSVLPEQLLGFDRQQYPDGSGSLIITTGHVRDSDGGQTRLTEELVGVPDIAKVEKLLRELKALHSN
jgi:hypothetical protein